MDIVKKHGNDEKRRKITIIVLEFSGKATAFSDNMMTKNGDTLKGQEAILVNIGGIDGFATASNGTEPAHEVVHLAGLQDAAPSFKLTAQEKKDLNDELKNEEIKKNGKAVTRKELDDAVKDLKDDFNNKTLNSYAPKSDDSLSKKNEKAVGDYFGNKDQP